MVNSRRLPTEHPHVGLTVIAATGQRFTSFAPYVPAIDDSGVVAFQAELRAGGSGVYAGQGREPDALVEPGGGQVSRVCSHPDHSREGGVCFYGIDLHGLPGVFLLREGEMERLAPGHGSLGPTMNDTGAVAFRARRADGLDAVYAFNAGKAACVASVGDRYAEFRGLPVIHGGGEVLMRASLRSGPESIELVGASGTSIIAETGTTFASLGNFPAINARGAVGFVAAHRELGEAAFVSSHGKIAAVALAGETFESFRGILISDSGPAALLATPRGGTPGVYLFEPGGLRPLLQIGSSIDGSRLAEFALNPVSVNNRGQLALRLGLEDGRGLIVRTEETTRQAAKSHAAHPRLGTC